MKILNLRRLTVYPRIFCSLYAIIGGYWIVSGLINSRMPVDTLGKPIGTDFVQFWTASQLALTANPQTVYQPDLFFALEQKVTGVLFLLPWHYPPSFQLMLLPLALLPYLPSLLLWTLITLTCYLIVLRTIAPDSLTLPLALAFPATFTNAMHGQNGFLSGALLGGGLLLIDVHPIMAGVLLGLVTFKPHLAILIPVALIAGRYWRTLAAMSATLLILVTGSGLLLGKASWLLFLENIPYATAILTNGALPIFKMPSVFASTLLAGASVAAATMFQSAITFAVVAVVVWVWYKGAPLFLKGSLLCLGAIMATPHIFEYDLTIVALPLAWMSWNAWRSQKCTLTVEVIIILAWLAPLVTSPIAKYTSVQMAPLFLGALCTIILQHFRAFISESEAGIVAIRK